MNLDYVKGCEKRGFAEDNPEVKVESCAVFAIHVKHRHTHAHTLKDTLGGSHVECHM